MTIHHLLKERLTGNDALAPHPAAEIFPLMADADFTALVADIRENGLLDAIVLHDGQILDGRHRYRACLQLGVNPVVVEWDGRGGTPADFVLSRNLHRRHLTSAQKREVTSKLLTLTPEKSNRQIAAAVGVDHKTVQAVRAQAEGRGEIPHVSNVTDTAGRKQPARKRAAKSKPEPSKVDVLTPASIAELPKGEPRRSFMDDPDVQAEAEAAARDLEMERDERIAMSGGTELAAENDRLRKQIGMLDGRINALVKENSGLKRSVKTWSERAKAAGWKGRYDA